MDFFQLFNKAKVDLKAKRGKKAKEIFSFLVGELEKDNIFKTTKELYKIYILSNSYIFGSSGLEDRVAAEKVIYHAEEYLKQDFFDYDINEAYIFALEFTYEYVKSLDKLKNLVKYPAFQEFALIRLESPTYYFDGLMSKEEYDEFCNMYKMLQNQKPEL